MTTFNGLVLEELGTVGNPTVEYANFVAETASPAGYDGAVLKNFKRDYTTIGFDLTLAGTESECINKLNTLVAVLHQGQGELVMPGQAERGTHFNAVPNMKIAHSLRGFDGMTVPLSFIVPEGCAVRERRIQVYQLPGRYEIGGFMPAAWEIEADVTLQSDASLYGPLAVQVLRHADLAVVSRIAIAIPAVRPYGEPRRVIMGSETMEAYLLPLSEGEEPTALDVSQSTNLAPIPAGEYTLNFDYAASESAVNWVFMSILEKSVW